MPWKRAFSLLFATTTISSSAQKVKRTSWILPHLSRRNLSTFRGAFISPLIIRNQTNNPTMASIEPTSVGFSTDVAAKSVDTENVDNSVGKKRSSVGANNSEYAIIRHLLGEERFRFKITLRNGKVFNFDRSVADTLQTFVDRIVTNVTKKVKTFDGNIVFLESPLTNGSKESQDSQDYSWEKIPNSVPLEDLLGELVNGSKRLNVQIGEDVYDVAINPPEIYAMKFLKTASVDFPVFPINIEASSKFLRDKSKYIWEFRPAGSSTTELDWKIVEKKSKKKGGNPQGQRKSAGNQVWKDTGCREIVFTPGMNLLGSDLKFTCIPSDGNGFGLPFSVEFPSAVAPSLVKNPLYEERLSRMKSSTRRLDPNFIRVVSYNCLADTYATEEWFVASPKGCLSADFRLPFLIKELEAYDADLYCLQEVDEKYFEGHFTPFFDTKLNFKGVFSCKVGNTKEGVATFYNPSKFELIRNESIVILEHMKLQSFWTSISSLSEEFLNRLIDRNTVLQVSIFRPKASQKTVLVVANTHLYFHPDADHIRCLQTITCVDYIERTIEELKKAFPTFEVALLFCGDFNCTPPFSSYRFLTTGKICENDEDWTSHSEQKLIPGINREHSLNLKNSHPGEELTNITTCFEGCLDYMLYQPNHFQLLNVYPIPDKSLIASLIGVDETRKVSLPNFNTPSDHLPLIGDFLLLTP